MGLQKPQSVDPSTADAVVPSANYVSFHEPRTNERILYPYVYLFPSNTVHTLPTFLSSASQGLLKPEGRQVLNQLGFYVFLPALAFTKLAQSVSWHRLGLWWPLPLNVLLR